MEHGERCLVRLDHLKSLLIGIAGIAAHDRRWRQATQEVRASAIVGSVAEVEALSVESIRSMNRAVNSSGLAICALKPPLRALAAHADFESLRTLADAEKVWSRRQFTTNLDSCTDPARLPLPRLGPQPPLDGGTPNPSHYARIWTLYGIRGSPFPGIRWPMTLRKLSGTRNDIAHGKLPFYEIFQAPGLTIADVEGYLEDMASFVTHLAISLSLYIDETQFAVASAET
jgi:hypothetical protein